MNENFDIEVILTKSGQKFLTPLSVSSLINKKIHTDIFSKKESLNHMEHINLTRKSDLVVVCPASANIIAKLANGYADDLASTTLAAANKKIFIVPAMNKKMWENPANKKNIKELKNNKKYRWILIDKKRQPDVILKKISKIKKKTISLGIAYSFQECPRIPVNKHDFKLDYIFTERGIISSN